MLEALKKVTLLLALTAFAGAGSVAF